MAIACVATVSKELLKLKDSPVDLTNCPNGLRDAVTEFFSTQYAVWELRVQLCINLETIPIENASVVWPEEQSPYVTVARITTNLRKPGATSALHWWMTRCHSALGMESLHIGLSDPSCVCAKCAYEISARFRIERNQEQAVEPTSLDNLAK